MIGQRVVLVSLANSDAFYDALAPIPHIRERVEFISAKDVSAWDESEDDFMRLVPVLVKHL